MKRIIAVLAVSMSCVYVPCVAAQEDKDTKIPAGMEVVQIRQTKIVVPVGMKYRKKGDLIVMENAEEYTARRLAVMEERLAKMEAQIQELSEKIAQLAQALSRMHAAPAPAADGENKGPS